MEAVWGERFYCLLKLATPELGPIALVNIRLAVAGLIFTPFLLQKKYLKHFRSNLKNILVLSIVNTALPFSLFAYASLESSSNMLSILNGTTAIMAVVISTIWLKVKLNRFQIMGVFIGLVKWLNELIDQALNLVKLHKIISFNNCFYIRNVCRSPFGIIV